MPDGLVMYLNLVCSKTFINSWEVLVHFINEILCSDLVNADLFYDLN